jgi:hypothetical protein
MSFAAFMQARFGPVFGPAARRAPSAQRACPAGRRNWFLAAIDAHTRRQIELALGERIEAFNHAVRACRARETPKEKTK